MRTFTNKRLSPFGADNIKQAQQRTFTNSTAHSKRLTILVPEIAESISGGTLTAFQRKINENVDANDEIATIETDKIDVRIDAPEDGHIVEFLVSEGDTVVVGQKVAIIETELAGVCVPDKSQENCVETPNEQQQQQQQHQHREAYQTTAKGDHAQSSRKPQDEQQHQQPLRAQHQQANSPAAEPPGFVPALQPYVQGSSETEDRSHKERVAPMPRMRLTIAKRLKESQNRTASLTAIQQVDMWALMNFRKLYKEMVLEQYEVRLGYMGAFTRAATIAAREVPEVNASVDIDNACIIYRDYVDISIAVSTPKGLVTPVLRGCESKSIVAIEGEVTRFAKKARDGKLTMDDISGGNFTISNPGVFGSLFGTPVINYPQSAVFNMNSIRDEPVVINGQVVIRPMMYITLTYDHRLIDGREAAEFLNVVKSNIEDPSKMLLAST